MTEQESVPGPKPRTRWSLTLGRPLRGSLRLTLGVAVVALLAGCQYWAISALGNRTWNGDRGSNHGEATSRILNEASPSAMVVSLQTPPRLAATVEEGLRRFYQGTDYRLAWFRGGVLRPVAITLLDSLEVCPDPVLPEGLHPEDLFRRVDDMVESGGDEATVAALDRDLSSAFLSCVAAMRRGVPGVLPADHGWQTAPEAPDEVALLRSALDRAERSEVAVATAFAQTKRHHPQRERLAAALAAYREIAAAGGWPVDLRIEETVEPGDPMSPEALLKLRRRLMIEGFLETDGGLAPDRYLGPLVQAVEAYQAARGLTVDGKLGAKTVASLNVGVEERIDQLRVNLQRSFWLPTATLATEVMVNIPAFRLDVEHEGRSVHRQRVVVGRRDWQTPIFNDEIESVVVHPVWNVPSSIASDEIVPRLVEDPDYLEEQGLEVLDGWGSDAEILDPAVVDWHSVDAGSLRFRQAPGPRNALGRIKFLFPNPHSVYLHDTPSRAAFARSDRARSHGCVRVEDPLALAQALLPEELFRTASDHLASGEPTTLRLPKTIPVRLVYMTAWVGPEGRVEFFDDVYDQDAPLRRAVAGWEDGVLGAAPLDRMPAPETRDLTLRTAALGDGASASGAERG